MPSDAKRVLELIDLTSLEQSDTDTKIRQLCQNANNQWGAVAAVCVYPQFVTLAKQTLEAMNCQQIKVATVVNFPEGTQALNQVVNDTHEAIKAGADEIDLVFPYAAFLQGDSDTCTRMLNSVKNACGTDTKLKVIIESGILSTPENIQAVTLMAILHGADFIKTSTGKVTVNATLEAAEVILETIRQYAPNEVGFKASGGIKTVTEASAYLALADNILGPGWADKQHFRFGASSLLTDVVNHLSEEPK